MIMKVKLIYIVNKIENSAVTNILNSLIPYLKPQFCIEIISLQPIDKKSVKIIEHFGSMNIIPVSLNCSKYNFIETYFRLVKYLKRLNPKIVHSNLGRADIFSAIAKTKNVRLLNTFHCEKKNHKLLTQIGYRLTDRRLDWRICISQTVARSYYNHGFKSPYSVIYNPIDINGFTKPINREEIRNNLGFKPNEQIIINVGRLIKCKGQRYLVEVMPHLCHLLPEIKLLIVGDGPQYNSLKKLISKYNLENNVYLLGYRQDVQNLLKISDLFVYSAQWEGLGMAVIEAMATRIPVLAHPLPALKEYIIDNHNGYFCNIHLKESFANKIYDILTNSHHNSSIAENAFRTVTDMFSADKISKQYIELYQQLLSNR